MRSSLRIEIGLCILLLMVTGLFCFERARQLRYDFHHFYRDAQYVWLHGELNPVLQAEDKLAERQLPFYLPIVPLMLAPLTFAGLPPAAAAWALVQVITLGYSLYELRRRWTASAGAFWYATVLASPALYEAAFFNQLSFPILALCLATVRQAEQNHRTAAALSLSLACIMKYLPGVLLVWTFLQQRRASALRFAALTAMFSAILVFLPCWAVFGRDATNRYLAEWWRHNLDTSGSFDLLDPEINTHFLGHTNQSVRAVVARWTWPEHPYRMPVQPVALDKSAVNRISTLISASLLALWIVITARAGRSGSSLPAQRASAAAWMIGMLVFSPLLRQYYLIWAWPALVFLAGSAGIRDEEVQGTTAQRVRRYAQIGLAVWLSGMLLWPIPLARLGGVHLLMLVVVAICTALAGRRLTPVAIQPKPG